MIIDNNIILEKNIGKGTFSEIYLATKKGSVDKYATKQYKRESIEGTEYINHLKNEIIYIQQLNHKNIIKYDSIIKTKQHFYLIYEYCNGGNLSTILNNYQMKYGHPFSQDVVQYLMKQIMKGLKYIHNKELIHGDLKLNSILVHFNTEKGKEELDMMKTVLKISHFKYMNKNKNILEDSFVNIKNKKKKNYNKNDKSKDIYNLGIMCYKMIFGNFDYNSNNYEKLINEIEEGKYKYPIALSKEILSFMKNMLRNDSHKRLEINELCNHNFLTKNINDLESIDKKKDNEKLHLCIYCLTNNSQIIFSPCGHKCTCYNCYIYFKKKGTLIECPVCRKIIVSFVEKVFEV